LKRNEKKLKNRKVILLKRSRFKNKLKLKLNEKKKKNNKNILNLQ